MTTEPAGVGGTPATNPAAAAPFAVTAPPELQLDAERTGKTTFTVTNLTGRPVRARLIPKGQNGAEDSWLSVVGESELPMNVGSTITADVQVKVPPSTAAGQHTLFLEVAAEDDTESVAGQAVSFTVPPPIRPKFPWLIVILAAVALLLIAAAVWFFFLRGPGTPVNTSPPLVNGVAQQGQALQAEPGEWDPDELAFTYQWRRCPTAQTCTAIEGATLDAYLITAADVGAMIGVDVSATNVDGESAAASSPLVGPVTPAKAPGIVVPNFVATTVVAAQSIAQALGLQLATVGANPAVCSPKVLAQSIPHDTKVAPGTSVVLTVNNKLPFKNCVVFDKNLPQSKVTVFEQKGGI